MTRGDRELLDAIVVGAVIVPVAYFILFVWAVQALGHEKQMQVVPAAKLALRWLVSPAMIVFRFGRWLVLAPFRLLVSEVFWSLFAGLVALYALVRFVRWAWDG